MFDNLIHLFSFLCGQNPEHTWAPGGIPLPCCQRCLGLYAGAAIAAWLHFWLRPELSGRFLKVHGVFLLLMVPFGYHWLPQVPTLRSFTGVLFGFGVVAFLRLNLPWLRMPRAESHEPLLKQIPGFECASGYAEHSLRSRASRSSAPNDRHRRYAAVLVATLVLLPLLASRGGQTAAYVLSGLAFFGALALCLLVAATIALGLIGTVHFVCRAKL